jgi:hypothetical protein
MMKIPFFHKPRSADHDCAPVCLQMALAYFQIDSELPAIYLDARCLGPTHFALPWGICLAAAKWGLYARFISRHPDVLINESVVARATGLTDVQVRHEVREQLKECHDSEIALVQYDENTHKSLPARVVARASKSEVVIPSLVWGWQDVHNVVLTDSKDGIVTYHEPNTTFGANQEITETEFLERWCDDHTDNDLLIISNDPLWPR